MQPVFNKFLLSKILCLILLGILASQAWAGADPKLFPRPAEIERDVLFWTRIFTDVDTKHGLIHDDWNLAVIYEKIQLPSGVSRRVQQRYIKKVKERYKKILLKLAKGQRSGLSREEQRVLDLWGADVSNSTLREATNRLRFQLGQSDKFLAGYKRSGAWRKHILKTLDDMGLPKEIANLPHVESSFNAKAYSKVGAAGLWQFIRSTGRRFMRVDHIVDERMDPFKATVAAARLLENNYAVTGTWPLALTAYNHGAAGMRNAAAKLGTTDIVTILRKYQHRMFKFASRNFYVAFLAVNDVDAKAEQYFGPIKQDPEIKDEIVVLDDYVPAKKVAKALGLRLSELKEKNPALRDAVWNGSKHIPRGYELRIDPGSVKGSPKVAIASISDKHQYSKQKPDLYHRVGRGQTLSVIAARYGVSVNDIMALNNLRSKHRIRVGQVLRLPQHGEDIGAVQVAETKKPAKSRVTASGKYKVRRGDTLYSIAKRFDLSTNDLLALNSIRHKNRIYPGQYLQVKAQEVPDTVVAAVEPDKKSPPESKTVVAAVDIETVTDDAASNDATVINDDESDAERASTQVASVDNVPLVEELNIADVASDEQTSGQADAVIASIQETTRGRSEMSSVGIPASVIAELNAEPEAVLAESDSTVALTTEATPAHTTAVEMPPIEGNAASFVKEDEVTASEEIIEAQSPLSADPTDYSVAKNKNIQVQAAETLGHYAEWLKLRASQLRRINRMRYGKPVVIGQRLKLDFSKVTPEEFEQQRVEYHRNLQEAFFEQYQIVGSTQHTIRRGDSLWILAKRKYKVPIWLLRQYNPDLVISRIHPGVKVTFPKLEERDKLEATPKSNSAIAVPNLPKLTLGPTKDKHVVR